MNRFVSFDPRFSAAKLKMLTTCGATILSVAFGCGGVAQAQTLSLGGVKAHVSLGTGGVTANVGIGGKTVLGAKPATGTGTTGGTGTNGGTGTAGHTLPGILPGVLPGVQVNVGVGPVVTKPARAKPVKTVKAVKPAKPIAIGGPLSVLGVDTNVAGLDVVADVLEFNGNLLDVCIGSCRDTTGGGGGGDPGDGGNGGDGGDGGNGGAGGIIGDGGGILPVVLQPGTVGEPQSAVALATDADGNCSDLMTTSVSVAMTDLPQNGNPGKGFAQSTADLNLPIDGVALRCSAGGNAQVFNGFSVVDSNGQKIGIVHDAFLTDKLTIRRVQFQGLDQRCFGLSNGKYSVKGASLIVDVPASFVYQ